MNYLRFGCLDFLVLKRVCRNCIYRYIGRSTHHRGFNGNITGLNRSCCCLEMDVIEVYRRVRLRDSMLHLSNVLANLLVCWHFDGILFTGLMSALRTAGLFA